MNDEKKEFQRVCSVSEMPRRFGKRVEVGDGVEVALFEIDNKLYAVDNICPHQKFPMMHEGDVADCILTCPMHGWQFDLRTGECVSGGNASLATFEVEIREGDIHVEVPRAASPKWMD